MSYRLLSLDTETTGLDFHRGERLVEIGIVEVIDRQPTGRVFHKFINPQRKVDPAALKVHGLTDEFLSTHPKFNEIAQEMMTFINGDDLLIHNAEFDLTFLNGELARCNMPAIDSFVLDTLEWVKSVEPGKRASLDAMADRYGVNRSARLMHGALIDARLLADVFVAMTRHQSGLNLTIKSKVEDMLTGADFVNFSNQLIITTPSDQEITDHTEYLKSLNEQTKGQCIWLAKEKTSNSARP